MVQSYLLGGASVHWQLIGDFLAHTSLSCKQHLIWSSGVERVSVHHDAKFCEISGSVAEI